MTQQPEKTSNMAYARKYDLRGKVALITGSSSGIGAQIALQFVQYGAKVTITGRNEQNLGKVAQKIRRNFGDGRVLSIVGDLKTDDNLPEKLVNDTIREYGRLDILINNAGIAAPKGTLSSENLMEEFDTVMKLNVRVVVSLTQKSVPYLEVSKGNIINISSVASVKAFWLVYSASKAALDMITKNSALGLGPKGVRCNSINPGPVSTAFGRSFGLDEVAGEALINNWGTATLLKRVATSDEIATLAGFLASDDAKNITGAIIISDGGMVIN